MGKTTNANGTKKNTNRASKTTKPRNAKPATAKKTETATPSERRTANGGYIRFTCSNVMHGRITSSAGKAGVSIVAHCLDIISKGIKAGTLAKLPSKLQDAPKNAKPYPCYVNVEMSASLRERVKKLGNKLGCPAHVVTRELVHSATKNAKPSTAKKSTAKKRTSAPKKSTAKKRTTAKKSTAKKRTTAKK